MSKLIAFFLFRHFEFLISFSFVQSRQNCMWKFGGFYDIFNTSRVIAMQWHKKLYDISSGLNSVKLFIFFAVVVVSFKSPLQRVTTMDDCNYKCMLSLN